MRRPECDEQPLKANVPEGAIEPDYDTQWRHRPAALGLNERSAAGRETAISSERLPKIGVQRGSIGRSRSWPRVPELDHGSDVAGWIEHHVPGQVGDFTGAQASLGGQQDDHTVTKGMPGAVGKDKEVADVANREYFCLFASHSKS